MDESLKFILLCTAHMVLRVPLVLRSKMMSLNSCKFWCPRAPLQTKQLFASISNFTQSSTLSATPWTCPCHHY